MLTIHLLGKISVDWNGAALEGELGRKALALLYLLLGTTNHFCPRSRLMLYLWPDSAEEAARYNLRYHLWLLKKVLPLSHGETLVRTEKDGCRLNDGYPWRCDLTKIRGFNPDRAQGETEELLRLNRLFTGEPMEGWYLKNCSEFNDLILIDRMMCERKHVKVLQLLAQHCREQCDDRQCLEWLLEIAAIEPNNEEVALVTMETHLRLGDRAGAIQHYRRFEAGLWNELSIAPDQRLQQLYRRIRQDKSMCPVALPTSAEPKQALLLEGCCVGDIPYFLLAGLLASALVQIDSRLLLSIDERYLRDLAPIQMELALCYERAGGSRIEPGQSALLEVRVIQAFCKFMEALCTRGRVCLRIADRAQADPVSAAALDYLTALGLSGLTMEETP